MTSDELDDIRNRAMELDARTAAIALDGRGDGDSGFKQKVEELERIMRDEMLPFIRQTHDMMRSLHNQMRTH